MKSASEIAREVLWGDGVARTRTVMASAFLVASIAYLLAVDVLGIETEVMRDRFWKNAEPLFDGTVPTTEYPPLALVFIAIPRLFGSDPWSYEVAYVALMWVFMVAGLCLVSRLARSLGRDGSRAMIGYGVLVLLMLEFVLDRFDIIAMVFALASFVLFIERRVGWAFVLLAIGVLTKVFPAVFFPIMLIALLCDNRAREAMTGFATFAATGLAAVAVCSVIDPELVTNFVGYNGFRPLQIESLAASVIYPFSMVGITDVWIQGASEESFWSDNLRGPLPDAVADVILPLAVALTAAVWVVYAVLRSRRDDGSIRLMSLGMLSALLAFMVMNKVFSAQYVIWAIAPLMMVVLTSSEVDGRRLYGLLVLAIVLTQADFVYNVGYLGGGANIDDLGMLVILAKNLVLVLILALVLRHMVRGSAGSVDSRPSTVRRSPNP